MWLSLDNGKWVNETQDVFFKTLFNTLNNLNSFKKFIAVWQEPSFSYILLVWFCEMSNWLYPDLFFYCWLITDVPLSPHSLPASTQPPPPIPHPLAFATLLSVFMGIYVLWLISSPSFIQTLPSTSPLTSIRLFHVSMPLVLFFARFFAH